LAMIEVGVVLGTNNESIYWHLPQNSSAVCLPDSRELWDVLWENRDRVSGFAHIHPWVGRPWPSDTDLTTFIAVENALGKSIIWWIATLDKLSLVKIGVAESQCETVANTFKKTLFSVTPQPWEYYPNWLGEIRRLSRIGGDDPWKISKPE